MIACNQTFCISSPRRYQEVFRSLSPDGSDGMPYVSHLPNETNEMIRKARPLPATSTIGQCVLALLKMIQISVTASWTLIHNASMYASKARHQTFLSGADDQVACHKRMTCSAEVTPQEG
jgi:capsule polysaccharide modification protein KpsS